MALVDELVGFIDASSAPSPESSDKSTIQQEPGFQVSMDGKLRIIKLNKPEKKNALTLTMYLGLVQLLQDAAKDPNTSLVAITGAGNFFCSGNDLTNLTSFTGTVEEADLPVETPVEAAGSVTAQALAFGRFCDVVEVVDL